MPNDAYTNELMTKRYIFMIKETDGMVTHLITSAASGEIFTMSRSCSVKNSTL